MVTTADTSFLFSLYGHDSNTEKAIRWTKKQKHPITITSLARFELLNALRFAECRKFINAGDADDFISNFETDLNEGRLVEEICNLAEVISEASRISEERTLKGGHRSFDILHIAAAGILNTDQFLSFDSNQKKLAKAEGLKTPL